MPAPNGKTFTKCMQQNKSFFKEMLTHGTLKPSNSLNLEAKKAMKPCTIL